MSTKSLMKVHTENQRRKENRVAIVIENEHGRLPCSPNAREIRRREQL